MTDYDDDGIMDQHSINDVVQVYFPKTNKELKMIVKERLKENPKEPYLSDINTSRINDMSCLFSGEEEVEILDLSGWNTVNIKSMYNMFSSCKSLKKIDFSNFNTSNVTEMHGTFSGCSSLKELDLSNFETTKVKTMSGMFFGCHSLEKVNLSSFDTSNVSSMCGMFEYCYRLENLDISNFNTSSVTNFGAMFHDCILLKTIDLSRFNTSKVTSMYRMFKDCKSLKTLDLSNFDTSKKITIEEMFNGCKSLETLDLSGFNITKRIKGKGSLFAGCESLKNVYTDNEFINKQLKDYFRLREFQRVNGLNENIHNFDVADYSEDDTIDNHSVNNVLWDFLYADELNDIFTDIEWTKYDIVNRDFVSYIRIYNNNSDNLVIYQLSDWFHKYTKETEYGFDSTKDGIDSTTAFIYDNKISSDEIILYILDDSNDYLEYSFSNKYDSYERKQYTLFKIQRIS